MGAKKNVPNPSPPTLSHHPSNPFCLNAKMARGQAYDGKMPFSFYRHGYHGGREGGG